MKETSKELKENGYKSTPARLGILDLFSTSKTPLNAESVYKKISRTKRHRDINEVTVYRTLSSLEESGLLKRVDLRKSSAYFELNKNHHHHISCTNCDEIEELKNQELEKILGQIVDKSYKFKSIKEHSVEFFGLCKECA